MITTALRQAMDEQIDEAVETADPMALRGLLFHATGDESLRAIGTADMQYGFSEVRIVVDPADVASLRLKAAQLLRDYRDGRREPPPADADPALLTEAMGLAAGEPIPVDEYALHHSTLALDPTPRGWGTPPGSGAGGDMPVIVVGAGLAGINAAIQLKASGIPFVLLDKNPGVGGTWNQNRYPGARVDWPSRLYSHSFGIGYGFRHAFAPRAENEDYLNWCVDTFGVRDDIRLNTMVTAMRWDDAAGLWHVDSTGPDGETEHRTARVVISAIGLLERPFIPDFAGMAQFRGVSMHSARFDPGVPLEGKRVAVIGTGASGMQMVPDLAPLVAHTTVFQRTPGWLLPSPGYRDPWAEPAQWLNRNMPYYASWMRFVSAWNLGDHRLFEVFEVDPEWTEPGSVNAVNHRIREHLLANLQAKLGDRPDLLVQCTPDYPPYGNRPVIDNGWLEAIRRDDVRLTGDAIDHFVEDGIVTATGEHIPVDIAIFATGFRPNDYFAQIAIEGRDGVGIDAVWAKDGPRAYWGVAAPHMPNFFMLYGPNANPRNLGPVQYGEWAIDYILTAMKRMLEQGWKSVEVSQAAYDAFNVELDRECEKLVSVNPRTRKESYYINAFGRSAVQSPWSSAQVMRAFSAFDAENYRIEHWPDGARAD